MFHVLMLPEQHEQTDGRRVYHLVWEDVSPSPDRLLFLQHCVIFNQHLVDVKFSDTLKLSCPPPSFLPLSPAL